MKYTAGQAAKATGVSTATISRALKRGKISGVKDANGTWSIDPSELHRVFPPLADSIAETAAVKDNATPVKDTGTAVLELEIQMLRDALSREQEISSDLKEDRDRWRAQATGLLADLRSTQEASSPATPSKKSLWARIFK